jgi:hypothetical protein
VLDLFSAFGSGDVIDAQSTYDSLTSLLHSMDNSLSSSTSISSCNISFSSLLSQIGSALSSGNISTAQNALDSFLSSLSSGSLVSATA